MQNLKDVLLQLQPRREGSTIFLKAGEYVFESKARTGSIQLDSNMSIIGEKGTNITITGDGTGFVAVNKQNIRLENLNIKFKDSSPNPFSTAFDLRGCNGIEIRNCNVRDCGASAVRAGRNSGSDSTGRIFDQLGEGYGPTRNLIISGCSFFNCVGPVVGFKPGGAQNVEIRDNLFNGFGTYAISAEGEGQPHGWTSSVYITNNYIYNGQLSFRKADFGVIFGIYVGEHAYNITILRNIIENIGNEKTTFCGGIATSTSPSQGDTQTSDITINYNCIRNIYGARSGCILLMPGNKDISGVSVRNNFLAKNYNNRILAIRPDPNKNLGLVRFLDTDEQQECLYNNLVKNGV